MDDSSPVSGYTIIAVQEEYPSVTGVFFFDWEKAFSPRDTWVHNQITRTAGLLDFIQQHLKISARAAPDDLSKLMFDNHQDMTEFLTWYRLQLD